MLKTYTRLSGVSVIDGGGQEVGGMMMMTRRRFMETGAGSVAGAALLPAASMMGEADASRKLASTAFQALPLGEIRPAGWLARQLRIQADGMGGHLDEFWPDVGANSGWLGGTGESWERGPYFLDGLVPLAWQLDDAGLKAKAMRFIDWTLEHQQPSGMIGPAGNNDWWPRMVMLKALTQYYEATADARVIPVMTRYFHYQLAEGPGRPLKEWGKYRWQEEVLVIEWLYERTGDAVLLQLASLLQAQGYDWEATFADFKYTSAMTQAVLHKAVGGKKPDAMATHGVNNGQALKTAAVQYRLTGDMAAGRVAFDRQLGALDRFHGMPNGMFSCDEHLGGLEPSHGSELCAVVETMYSLEVVLAAFGDAAVGDRIEKIAYNALPGTFDDAMWAHQYDQQPNQIQVGLNSKPWTTNGPESNLYGLEPNFGCCTANFHQGWPKLTSSLWMRSPDGGLVAAVYAPCRVETMVGATHVSLRVETEYPFKQDVRIAVSPAKAASFPLRLRIPGWAAGASIRVNGKAIQVTAEAGTFAVVERRWQAGDVVELHLPMKPVVTRHFHQSIALMRGPLVFSYDPGESWVKLRDRGRTADWQVFPRSAWNYALAVDEQSVGRLEVQEAAVGARPFAAAGAAVKLRVKARRVDGWRSEDGVAAAPPEGMQRSANAEETLEFVPYGAAKLRVTAFPQLET